MNPSSHSNVGNRDTAVRVSSKGKDMEQFVLYLAGLLLTIGISHKILHTTKE